MPVKTQHQSLSRTSDASGANTEGFCISALWGLFFVSLRGVALRCLALHASFAAVKIRVKDVCAGGCTDQRVEVDHAGVQATLSAWA